MFAFCSLRALQSVVKPTNATNVAVIWHSDNPAIAAIAQDGTVTALSAGTATITVKTEFKTAALACNCAGKRALLVSEKLAFEQAL